MTRRKPPGPRRVKPCYSASDLTNLIAASEKASEKNTRNLPQTDGSLGLAIRETACNHLTLHEIFWCRLRDLNPPTNGL